MSKERLISHIVEKARISTQRAELAYDAFWESIISELKTGAFSLPYGAGMIHLREKQGSALKEFAKASGIKSPAPEAKVAPEKKGGSSKAEKKVPAKAKDKVSKAAPAKKNAKPAKKAPVKKATAKKAPAKKTAKGKKK